MEKLIKLLNEYEVEKEKSEWQETDVFVLREWTYTDYSWIVSYDRTDQWEGDHYYSLVAVPYIISKSYWFIKWLVENDKIDHWKIFNKARENNKLSMIIDLDNNEFIWEETLLMLLSMQDEPIEFLVSILK